MGILQDPLASTVLSWRSGKPGVWVWLGQSGTADSPSILNASPESAAGGGLAWVRTGDIIRIDLNQGRCDMLVDDTEIARRKREGLPAVPASVTPWQQIYRATVGHLSEGAVIEQALIFRDVARTPPRHNH